MEYEKQYKVENVENVSAKTYYLNKIIDRIKENNKKINEYAHSIEIEEDNYKETKKSKNKSLRKLTSRLLILACSVTIFVSSFISYNNKYDNYKEGDKITYSQLVCSDSEDDKGSYQNIEVDYEEKDKEHEYLIIYNQLDEDKNQYAKAYKYDVTEYDFKSKEEAFAFDYTTLQPIESYVDDNHNINVTKEYIIASYTKEHYSNSSGRAILILTYIQFLLSGTFLILFSSKYPSLYNSHLKKYKESKKDLNKNKEYLLKLLKENEEYKNEYIKVLNEIVPYINDSSGFYEKLVDNYDEVKTLSLIKKLNELK